MELRVIPQFNEHSISEDGKTITNSKGRIIKQGPQILKGKPSGYLYATMLAHDYSYLQRVGVHRLVAFAWIPAPPTSEHVWINHKDGDKANNHADNLEWTTIKQNIQHAYRTGLHKVVSGADHWRTGKTMSVETKKKMSLHKQGERHPMFKGYWFVNFKRYTSANSAAKDTGMCYKTIARRCRNPKYKTKGYYFIPVNNEKAI